MARQNGGARGGAGKPPRNLCGRAKRDGTGPCTRGAGWGTDHPGTGACKMHGGRTPIKHGLYARYDLSKHPRLATIKAHLENDPDPENLLPDVTLLRAQIQDYIERYDTMTEALIAWYDSFNPEYEKEYQLWHMERLRWQAEYAEWQEKWMDYRREVEEVQGYYRQGWPEPPDHGAFNAPPTPPFPNAPGRPRQVVDILSVGKFIAAIGALVEKMQKIKNNGAVTYGMLHQALQMFGLEFSQGVQEVVSDETLREAIYEAVEGRWSTLSLANLVKRPPDGTGT